MRAINTDEELAYGQYVHNSTSIKETIPKTYTIPPKHLSLVKGFASDSRPSTSKRSTPQKDRHRFPQKTPPNAPITHHKFQ